MILLTIAYQVPLSMGFFRQEYWSGLLFPSPGDLPKEPAFPALAGGFVTTSAIWETHSLLSIVTYTHNYSVLCGVENDWQISSRVK